MEHIKKNIKIFMNKVEYYPNYCIFTVLYYFYSNILFHSNFPTFVFKSGIFFSPFLSVILSKSKSSYRYTIWCEGKSGHHRVA